MAKRTTKRYTAKTLLREARQDKEASATVDAAKPREVRKRPLEVLRNFMGVYHGMAAMAQPTEVNAQRGTANEEKFHQCATRACRIAAVLVAHENAPPPSADDIFDLSDMKDEP